MSADELREQHLQSWDAAAAAWGRQAERWEGIACPVTERLLELAELGPGDVVLELGAGAGETGRRAAERVAPDGHVLVTDPAPGMAAQARVRLEGVAGVEVAEENAEWIDRAAASFDAVISRWGLMFPLDLDAAFRECRRVLRPGGHLALAAWTTPEENPWMAELTRELLDQGLIDPPDPNPDAPGPFRLGDPARLCALLADAGFVDPVAEPLPFVAGYDGVDDYWALHTELSGSAREALALTNERGRAALREGLDRRLAPYAAVDGRLEVPACALMASASA